MKRVINFLIGGLVMMSVPLFAQRPADTFPQKPTDRMGRDIAVMETALSEMIKQEFNQRNFFFMDVKGSYVSGYGVTFTVPTGMFGTVWSTGGNEVVVVDGHVNLGSVTIASPTPDHDLAITEKEAEEAKQAMKNPNKNKNVQKERDKTEREAQVSRDKAERELQNAREAERDARGATVYGIQSTNGVNGGYAYSTRSDRTRLNSDSMNAVNNLKIVNAAKTFIADYGDMLSQLAPTERIVVTNKITGENRFWYNGQQAKRSLLSVEANKSDLTQFRQGNMTRDQLLAKMKVINTTTSEKTEPDMELLASIFNRLYREDLSGTYYMQGGAYYERLTDFGVILHMQVVSSTTNTDMYGNYSTGKDLRLTMPTLRLNNLTQEERDKKVKELYPVFESELKENLLDYGRTLKSLKDNEQLIVDVGMTKCTGCGIPTSLELAVKASVLKEYSAGKLDKSAALSKIEVKKGPNQ